MATREATRIVILGAGPGGLCMGIRLQQSGFDDFAIVEKAEGVGGTWRHNRYPGCECDIPSHLYSFSFEPKSDWSKPYGTQPELLAYLEETAEKYGMLPRCRFGDAAVAARWDDSASHWTVELESGERLEADVVVSAIGMFNDLAWPDIEGIDSFEGTSFHSARWHPTHSLTGERVGVIGSAASAVQLVPEIVKEAGQVHLFQRTANWVLPKDDTPFTEEQLQAFGRDPEAVRALRNEIYEQIDPGLTFSDAAAVAQAEEYGLFNLLAVEDPDLREKLRPQHPFGCKRPLLSNLYYPAFNRPNLELVTEDIERITARGVVTADGLEREVDTLVFATGFETTKYLSAIEVVGRDGLRIADAWSEEGAAAYLGITSAGFPNLFQLYGPNTNNGSLITMIEYQVEHALELIGRIADEDLARLEVRPDVMARYNREIDERMADVQAWQADCTSYYRSPSGRIVTQWPGNMTDYRERIAKVDPDAYEAVAR